MIRTGNNSSNDNNSNNSNNADQQGNLFVKRAKKIHLKYSNIQKMRESKCNTFFHSESELVSFALKSLDRSIFSPVDGAEFQSSPFSSQLHNLQAR